MNIEDLKPNSLIAVDLDGVISDGEFWDDKREPKPIEKGVELVEKLYRAGHHIVIFTARHRKYFLQTESWLIKHGIYYHSISMEKMGADLYIDDKCININDI